MANNKKYDKQKVDAIINFFEGDGLVKLPESKIESEPEIEKLEPKKVEAEVVEDEPMKRKGKISVPKVSSKGSCIYINSSLYSQIERLCWSMGLSDDRKVTIKKMTEYMIVQAFKKERPDIYKTFDSSLKELGKF